ncbi:hypothetical protein NC652_014674 [Populus alba x Populus x berolinensis]|nr:hypothetical protein NC652_014674 [Populus alba x Populus x berolinensis]
MPHAMMVHASKVTNSSHLPRNPTSTLKSKPTTNHSNAMPSGTEVRKKITPIEPISTTREETLLLNCLEPLVANQRVLTI